jgi:hypothetical protein
MTVTKFPTLLQGFFIEPILSQLAASSHTAACFKAKPKLWMAVTGHYQIQICFKAWIFKGDTISD